MSSTLFFDDLLKDYSRRGYHDLVVELAQRPEPELPDMCAHLVPTNAMCPWCESGSSLPEYEPTDVTDTAVIVTPEPDLDAYIDAMMARFHEERLQERTHTQPIEAVVISREDWPREKPKPYKPSLLKRIRYHMNNFFFGQVGR